MNEESFIQVDKSSMATSSPITLGSIKRGTSRLISAPSGAKVALLQKDNVLTLTQNPPNMIFEGLNTSDYDEFGTRNSSFLGIQDISISRSKGKPNRPSNLVNLLQQAEKKFDFKIATSVWFSVGQPMLGLISLIKKIVPLPRHLKASNLL